MVADTQARRQARKDLRSKIKLEKDFIRKLTTLNNKIIKKSVVSFARNGIVLNAREFESQLSDLLLNQYERSAREFSDQIRLTLPKDLESTTTEDDLIDDGLIIFFAARAIIQSQLINRTNQTNIAKSIADAANQLREEAEPGQLVTQREIAKTSGVLLRRKFRSRTGLIATTEVQTAAEVSKAAETAVLTRNPLTFPRPAIALPGPQIVIPQLPPSLPLPKIEKEWVTAGDEVVRHPPDSNFNHVAADGQLRDIDKPFEVSGQLLRIPGDTSLGASLGNIMRCRCASVVSREDVRNARKAIFDAETALETETEVDVPEFGFTS